MRKTRAAQAKIHRGRRIARIVPEANRRQQEIDEALSAIRELGKRTGKIALGELLSARDEGRKA